MQVLAWPAYSGKRLAPCGLQPRCDDLQGRGWGGIGLSSLLGLASQVDLSLGSTHCHDGTEDIRQVCLATRDNL